MISYRRRPGDSGHHLCPRHSAQNNEQSTIDDSVALEGSDQNFQKQHLMSHGSPEWCARDYVTQGEFKSFRLSVQMGREESRDDSWVGPTNIPLNLHTKATTASFH